jgi:enoyl-CoA hydratase/carnithine racemase
MPTVIVEERNHVLHMGFNRPAKRNAFNVEMLEELGRAYERLERDDNLRAGVLYAEGDNFTAGLDLAEIGPRLMDGTLDWPDDARNPWRNDGRPWTKPVVAAAHGWCLTLGIELLLASDVRIASADARFAQLEVQRGIYPFGGATTRLPRDAGWGNAMRWLLTGDEFDAAEALRIGLVQEVVEPGQQRDRAIELAERIATRSAPLAVRTTLAAAQRANRDGERAAEDRFVDDVVALFKTSDGAEGIQAFIERRQPRFSGA